MPSLDFTVWGACLFFFNDTATTEIYTLSLQDALPISGHCFGKMLMIPFQCWFNCILFGDRKSTRLNSSHLGISYAVFCLKKKRVGIIALVTKGPPHRLHARVMNANLSSIIPRVVGVWDEARGHEVFFFNDTAPTEIYPLPLPDALPVSGAVMMLECSLLTLGLFCWLFMRVAREIEIRKSTRLNSSHLGISYAVFCL